MSRRISPPARRTGGVRRGGRSERVVHDILQATAYELAHSGYGGLRFDEIAARSGVARTTIYRRWPTKIGLVKATIRFLQGQLGDAELFDTGSLRSDLVAYVSQFIRALTSPDGRALGRVFFPEVDDPEVRRVVEELRVERHAPIREAIERGVARTELPSGTDTELLVDILVGTISGSARAEKRLDARYAESLVEVVLLGAMPRPIEPERAGPDGAAASSAAKRSGAGRRGSRSRTRR